MRETQKTMEQLQGKKLLLHSCCAPCSGGILADLVQAKIQVTLFFYNPNIHPYSEYEKRKTENKHYAEKLHIPFIDMDYSHKEVWFERTAGLEGEPERGKRCDVCFNLRLQRTADYAHENSFDYIATTLGISRHKNLEQVNRSGLKAAKCYPGLTFFDYNWRKNGGMQRSAEISRRENFYRQEYCGCIFSLMDANHYRKQKGKPLIKVRP
jgi:predicted adenine nucleotide alpha hydrolase (AANH) superfamily ATPase